MRHKLMLRPSLIMFFAVLSVSCSVDQQSKGAPGNAITVGDNDWSFGSGIVFNDANNAGLGKDTSGLHYQARAIEGTGYLWVVNNGSSKLKRLKFDDQNQRWVASAGDWRLRSLGGKKLDAEAVTKAKWDSPLVYIASENDDNQRVSRLSIIEYDTRASKTTREWDLTHDSSKPESIDLKVSGNKGFEGLTWIPDIDLVKSGFIDDACARDTNCDAYIPSAYGKHGKGLFVVSTEGQPKKNIKPQIYIYALLDKGDFRLVSKLNPNIDRVVGLEYDRSTGYLWAHCDNADKCQNSSSVYAISDGHFQLFRTFRMPNPHKARNFEGIAVFPDQECIKQNKTIIWADDNGSVADTLASDRIPCGKFIQ